MTDAPAPPRPKRSRVVPLLVLVLLGVLLASVWWHIRSQHAPSLALRGEVVAITRGEDGRVNLAVLVHGLTVLTGVKIDLDARDATGRTPVVGFSITHETDETARAAVGLRPAEGVASVTLTMAFSWEVAAVNATVDRMLRLAPRREQMGQVTLEEIRVANPLASPAVTP